MRAPEFWQRDGLAAHLLTPVGALYALGARLREAMTVPAAVAVPILCIGNLTLGGAGKTPIAIALGQRAVARGLNPIFLTRGYGGSMRGPVAVDPMRHGAVEVGDEPLLLAQVAPTIVSRDRPAGGRDAARRGAGIVIMDDGLQNPTLDKSAAILVIDGATGWGNGRVFPAGPLREPLARGFARAASCVVIGAVNAAMRAAMPRGMPVHGARLAARDPATWRGLRVHAFSGIARPEKFFTTLREIGADIVATTSFADHHMFSTAELDAILDAARRTGARPVTTAKDHVRLPPDRRDAFGVLEVHAVFDDSAAPDQLLDLVQQRHAR